MVELPHLTGAQSSKRWNSPQITSVVALKEIAVFLLSPSCRSMSLLIEVVDPVVVEQNGSENTTEVFDQENTGINFDAYEDIPVKTSGNVVPPPINTFSEIDLGESLNNNLRRCNYVKPTPVQKYDVPISLAGRDLMACAQDWSPFAPIKKMILNLHIQGMGTHSLLTSSCWKKAWFLSTKAPNGLTCPQIRCWTWTLKLRKNTGSFPGRRLQLPKGIQLF